MLYMMVNKADGLNLVKVGVTRNLEQRKRSYKTTNPTARMICSCAGTERMEKYCHKELASTIGLMRITGTEWFSVPEDFYNRCLKEGLSMFPKLAKNKIKWYGIL